MRQPVMRAGCCAGIVVVLTAAAGGQTAMAQHRVTASMKPSAVRMPEGVDTVRLPLRTSMNHVLLPVSVNGSEPLSVVLDTGMPIPGLMLFDGDRLEGLSLEYGNMRAQVGGAGGDGKHMEARVASGARLGLGNATFDDVRVIVMPPIHGFSLPHDGIIGLDVFLNFTVRIDYDAGEILLTRPDRFEPLAGATEVPIELKQNLPYVDAAVIGSGGEEVPVHLVLDLGATHAVSLNTTTHEGLGLPAGAIPTRIGRGVSGEVTGHVGRIAGFRIGDQLLKSVVATFPDPEHENPRGVDSRNGNLGMDIMHRFNLTFDYAGGRIYLEPNKSFEEPFNWDMSGVTVDPGDSEGFEVVAIVPGSPAEVAGLRPGDVILGVDGQPISRDDLVRLRDLLRREGAEVSVEFRRGSEVDSVTLRLRRLI